MRSGTGRERPTGLSLLLMLSLGSLAAPSASAAPGGGPGAPASGVGLAASDPLGSAVFEYFPGLTPELTEGDLAVESPAERSVRAQGSRHPHLETHTGCTADLPRLQRHTLGRARVCAERIPARRSRRVDPLHPRERAGSADTSGP